MSICMKAKDKKGIKIQTSMDRKSGIRYLVLAGIMAALITIMTAYICHIPVGTNGGYVHFGDALIYLSAVLLPKPYALAAAAIGGGLADLLTAPMWVPATVIIKMLIVLPFTCHSGRIVSVKNVIACILAYFISGIGYFAAQYILFETASVFWVSMLQSLLQAVGSAVFFIVFGMALDKADFKKRIMN